MLFDINVARVAGSKTYRLFSATAGGITVIGDLLVKFDCADHFCHYAYELVIWILKASH